MNSLRITNLRSIRDSGEIELRPITILVGANSSGKSTLLRVLPLLRQSAETRTGSGLLLNEPYVDFGLFPIALRNGAHPQEIGFQFGLAISMSRNDYYYGPSQEPELIPVKIEVAFARKSQDARYSFVRRLTVRLGEPHWIDLISIEANEEGTLTSLEISSTTFPSETAKLRVRGGRGLIPTLVDQGTGIDDDGVFVRDEATHLNAFTDSLLAATDHIFHGRTLKETRINILRAIRYASPEKMLKKMASVTDNGSWNTAVSQWTTSNATFVKVRNLLIGDNIGEILARISAELNKSSRNVHYFEPIRARVQRDYVSRDVQVESIEPDGKNLAMFITSLGADEKASLQDWLIKSFGFSVHAVAVGDGARVSLRLREDKTKVEQNLADMGFGYSQMLPLLVQIWALTVRLGMRQNERNRHRFWEFQRMRNEISRSGYIVAIEQPELHLHPALQARLADLFARTVEAAKQTKVPVKFVVETHSPTLINRLGYLIEKKGLATGECQVLLFERGAPGVSEVISEIRKSIFDENGVLQDWPFGFLNPPVSDDIVTLKSDPLPQE
jgi:hypothetical protein